MYKYKYERWDEIREKTKQWRDVTFRWTALSCAACLSLLLLLPVTTIEVIIFN